MTRLLLEVLRGGSGTFDTEREVVRLGASPASDLVLAGEGVEPEHARLLAALSSYVVEDAATAAGTAVLRDGVLHAVGPGERFALREGDEVQLGGGAGAAVRVRFAPELESTVVELRRLADLPARLASDARSAAVLGVLSAAQRRIATEGGLQEVASCVADAALELVPRATHATVALRDDAEATPQREPVFVTVVTRVRGQSAEPAAPVPISRSVVRRVVLDRAAVLATDAEEAFASESMLGASIRSTVGVPLWRGEEIIGVVQVDSRGAPALFDEQDLDALSVLAGSASLAVANARLIQRLEVAEQQLSRENAYLKSRERERAGGARIIGQSSAMKQLLAQIDRVADTRVSVLVEGETGVGKELVAAALHFRSRRRARMFIAQNCAALPENLLESELFGHRRGAFTGATEDKRGLFDLADGGTLFLDEIGELPLALQAKLLRVLQEGELRPLGATQTRQVDVRVIAATNRNLEQEVERGRFREDLYYRLRVFPLRVPPLRERASDVPLLAAHFLARYTREFGKPVAGLAQETLETLASYDWPGNVRELENEVQRLVIQAEPEGWITPDMLSPRVRKVEELVRKAGALRGTLREVVEQVERWYVLELLREHDNNKTATAKVLGMTREGLHKKLRQLGIS